MGRSDDGLTLGVEEEFQLVEPDTRAVIADARTVLRRLPDPFEGEIELSVVETRTAICRSLADVRRQLESLRADLVQAAERAGCRVAAGATLPILGPGTPEVTPSERYLAIAEHIQHIVRSQLVSGCHVHVGVANRDDATEVLNRVRPWLPTLLALSANSPFWRQTDTGYASYRTVLWGQWPSAQMPGTFRSSAEYDGVVEGLINADIILDAAQVYWDVRLAGTQPTLEFRTADVCPTVDEAVAQAGLSRALTRTCLDEVRQGQPVAPVRAELLRGAKWHAARYGLSGGLVDPLAMRTVPAGQRVHALVTYLRPALEELGDWAEVTELVERITRDGTGADRQRRAFATAQRYTDVVDFLIAETLR